MASYDKDGHIIHKAQRLNISIDKVRLTFATIHQNLLINNDLTLLFQRNALLFLMLNAFE
jgi:hypothetical protein